MDNPVCVSCRKGLSLEDIERGNFKHIGGRLYCADCVGKMRRVGPVTCPQCGTTDTPLYTGKGYLCRKCGAEVQPGSQAAKPRPAAAARSRPAGKRCPYCGAVIPADALKCRYCGSLLTRDSRDVETFSRQNSQLRFWLGCLVSASAFLLLALVYALASRGPAAPAEQPGASAAPTTAAATADASAALVKELREELRAVRAQLAELKAEQDRLAAAKESAPPALPDTSRIPKALLDAMQGATLRGETPSTKAVAPEPPKKEAPAPPPVAPKVEPPSKEATKGTGTPKAEPRVPEPKQEARTAAQLAAAAYPVFVTQLDKLKAARQYGGALSACRQFLAAHLGTPEAEKAQTAQKVLRDELDRVRDEHARRFKQAADKGDIDTCRRVIADLTQYDAPEIREDRDRMLAEIKALEHKPALDVTRYLTQWEAPGNVERLLQELKTDKDRTVRSRAAKELGRVRHSAGIQGLLDALKDEDWYVKNCAIGALQEIGDPIALPYIVPLAKASFPAVYTPAALACRALAAAPRGRFAEAWKLIDPKPIAHEIAEALKVQDKEESPVTARYQVALIETLAFLDAKDAAPVIRPLFDKAKDPAVRKAAADAIKKLTGEALIPEPAPPPKAEPPKEGPKPEPPKETPKPPEPKAPEPRAPPAKS